MTTLNRLESSLAEVYDNKRHLETAADQVYMSCLRTNTDLDDLLGEIENGSVFDLNNFIEASSGNVYEYIKTEYRHCVSRFVNITAGGNGGMASIGRGEFMISFATNFRAKISKAGRGDLEYIEHDIDEEMKWNGGKIEVAKTQGKEVYSAFMNILKRNGEDTLLIKDFLPFRKKDKNTYSEKVIETLNARFWEAITGDSVESLSDSDLKKLCLKRAFDLVFDKSDSILIANEDGEFVRFTNSKNAVEYYSGKIDEVSLEIRAKQTNPIAIYLFV